MNLIRIYDVKSLATVAVKPVNSVDSRKEQLTNEILKLFPSESTIKQLTGDRNSFSCVVEHPASTKEAFDDWLKYHSMLSGVVYKLRKTTKKPTFVYYAIYGCNRSSKSSQSHIACKATLRVNIRRVLTESGEFTMPAVIKVDYCHNHELSPNVNSINFAATVSSDIGLRERIVKLFPSRTKIVSAVSTGSENEFTCILKIPAKTKQEFMIWLDEHSTLSCITYRLKNTSNKGNWLYNAYFRCHHNTKSRKDVKKPHEKHTNCNASLHVIIKDKDIRYFYDLKVDLDMLESLIVNESYPTIVTLNHKHNHRIMSATALVFRDPSPQIKEKFTILFKNGVEPSRALHIHHTALIDKYGEEYYRVVSDRRICPDKQWVYRLYYSLFNPKRSPAHFHEMVTNLRKHIKRLNSIQDRSADIAVIESSMDIAYAICTPFMKRVHSLGSAGEIVYVDSSGNVDKLKFRTFLLLCDTSVGGLPLGVFVTTSESVSVMTVALEMLKKLFPDCAFGGKGQVGPSVLMIDNNIALETSVKNVYNQSIVLFSTFHLLQTAWRWVFNGDNKITFKDRHNLIDGVSELVHSSNLEILQDRYSLLLKSTLFRKYPNFVKFLENLYVSRKKWAHIYLRDFSGESDNLEILAESSVRVLNDRLFKRVTTTCMVELFEFSSNDLTNFYIRKIMAAIGGCKDDFPKPKYLARLDTDNLLVVKLSEVEFEIRSSKTRDVFSVDMEIGVCECPPGTFGVPCEHQQAARETCMVAYTSLPGVEYSKQELYNLAVGPSADDEEWFGTLKYDAKPSVSVVESKEEIKFSDAEFTATSNKLLQGIQPLFRSQPEHLMKEWTKFTDEALNCKTAHELVLLLQGCQASKSRGATSCVSKADLEKTPAAHKNRHICGKKCNTAESAYTSHTDHESYTLKSPKKSA